MEDAMSVLEIKKVNRDYDWTNEQERLLLHWAECSSEKSILHNIAFEYYRRRNIGMTIPVIALTTITGSANFAVNMIPADSQSLANGVIGGLSIFAAIVTGVATYLKFAELQESHRMMSIEWRKLYEEIEVLTTTSYEYRGNAKQTVDKYSAKIKGILEQAPLLTSPVLKIYFTKYGKKPREFFELRKVLEGMHTRYYRLYPEAVRDAIQPSGPGTPETVQNLIANQTEQSSVEQSLIPPSMSLSQLQQLAPQLQQLSPQLQQLALQQLSPQVQQMMSTEAGQFLQSQIHRNDAVSRTSQTPQNQRSDPASRQSRNSQRIESPRQSPRNQRSEVASRNSQNLIEPPRQSVRSMLQPPNPQQMIQSSLKSQSVPKMVSSPNREPAVLSPPQTPQSLSLRRVGMLEPTIPEPMSSQEPIIDDHIKLDEILVPPTIQTMQSVQKSLDEVIYEMDDRSQEE